MSIMTVTTHVNHKWYMRKTKDDIIECIKELYEQLNLGKPDLLKYRHWDKYSLAHEAMRLHRLFPEEPRTKTFEVPDEVLQELRAMRMEWWKGVVMFRGLEQDATKKGRPSIAAKYERNVGMHLRRVQLLNFFFPDPGDTAERDYDQYKQHRKSRRQQVIEDGNQRNEEKS